MHPPRCAVMQTVNALFIKRIQLGESRKNCRRSRVGVGCFRSAARRQKLVGVCGRSRVSEGESRRDCVCSLCGARGGGRVARASVG
eukprot:441150-Rhodomonas_salina.1